MADSDPKRPFQLVNESSNIRHFYLKELKF